MMQIQANLAYKAEQLQIAYPPGFPESDKTYRREDEIFIGGQPRWLTKAEFDLVDEFVNNLPYRQKLVKTGAIRGMEDDPLRTLSQEEFDRVEKINNLPNTRNASAGGERSVLERALIVREQNPEAEINIRLSLPPVMN